MYNPQQMIMEDKLALEADPWKMQILNPRDDRTLHEYGIDTKEAKHMNNAIKKMLKKVKMNKCRVRYMEVHPTICLPFGKCHLNCIQMTNMYGGKVVYGWQIFEGKYCVEIEAHVAYEDTDGKLFNVTSMNPRNHPHGVSVVQGGLLVQQDADDVMSGRKRSSDGLLMMPGNKLYWK